MQAKQLIPSILSILIFLFFISCSNSSTGTDDPDPEPEIEINVVEDIDADNKLTLFSLRTGEIVDIADSASTQWDIGFSILRILTNSGESGPGDAGAIVLNVPFDEITIAPSEGYAIDTTATTLAIPTGSGNGWYNYNPSTHIVTPLPDRTMVLRTADGNHYAKLEIISYYKGNPETPTLEDSGRHYTFRYAIQQTEGLRELN